MSMKNELKDLALEGLALLITGVIVTLLTLYTDLGRWPIILIGAGMGIGAVLLIMRGKRKS